MSTVDEAQFRRIMQRSGKAPDVVKSSIESGGHEIGFDMSVFQKEKPRTTFMQSLKDSTKGLLQGIQSSIPTPPVQVTPEGIMENEKEREAIGQFAIDKPVLPIAGAIFGGLLGGVTTLGVGTIPASGIGAGIGAEAQIALQRMQGKEITPMDEAKRVGTEAALAAAGEGIFRGIGYLGGKALKPFAKKFIPEIAKTFEKYGIKAPASAVSESNVVRLGEATAAKGITGEPVQSLVQKAAQDVAQIGDDFVTKIGGATDLEVAGKAVMEGAESYKHSWQGVKRGLYQEADNLLTQRTSTLPREYINVDATKQALDEILSSKGGAKELLGDLVDTNKLGAVRNNLDKKLSIKILSSALDEINQMVPFGKSLVDSPDVSALKKIAATLSKDLDSHIAAVQPEIGSALSAADDFYAKGIGLLESEAGGRIAQLADSPEKIIPLLLKPNAKNQTRRLMELVGSTEGGFERLQTVRSSFLKEILDRAKNEEGELMGRTLFESIKKHGTVIDELYDEFTAQGIREVAQMASALGRGTSAAKGSQTLFLAKLSAFFGALFSGNFPAAVGIAAQDIAFSKIFSTEFGRQLVTKGFEMAVPQGVQSVGRGVIQSGMQGVSPSSPNP